MSTEIAKDEFQKSLARLEGLAKSQLFHTPSDSNPSSWAGSSNQDEDSMDDSIDANGTDYNGVRKALTAKVAASKALTPAEVLIAKGQNPYAAIGAKIAKGETLTAAERWATGPKGRAVFKGMESVPKKDGAAEENKEPAKVPDGTVADKDNGKELPEVGTSKSLADAAQRQPNLQRGIEMSPILHEFTVAMGHALAGLEARTAAGVAKSIGQAFAPIAERLATVEKALTQQGDFNKSLAEAVVGIGQHVAGGAEQAAAAASLPAGGPRSQLRSIPGGGQGNGVTPIQKSFEGPGGLESGEPALNKSIIVNAMADMVKSGKLHHMEVIKFESTGQLSPGVQQSVMAWAQGNRS